MLAVRMPKKITESGDIGMRKLVCDRCLAEINHVETGAVLELVRISGGKILNKDLCASCAFELEKWFERGNCNA